MTAEGECDTNIMTLPDKREGEGGENETTHPTRDREKAGRVRVRPA